MDRYGRIPLIRAAAVLRLSATLSFLLIDSVAVNVYASRAAYGVGLALFNVGVFTYANDVIPPDRRAQGIAWYGLSGMSAITFAAALGEVLIGRFGYTGLFLGMAFVEVAALGVALNMKPLASRPSFTPQRGRLSITRHRSLIPVWVLTFGFGLGFGGLLTFMRTFIDDAGFGSVGMFFTAYSVTAIASRLALSSLPDRLGAVRVALPAVASLAAGVGLLAVARTPGMLIVSAVLAGLGHAFLFPILGGLTVDRAPEAQRGVALSAFTAMFDLGPLLGAPILGLVIEGVGYPAMWLLLAGTIVVALAVFVATNQRVVVPA
jgi:MFS family permease